MVGWGAVSGPKSPSERRPDGIDVARDVFDCVVAEAPSLPRPNVDGRNSVPSAWTGLCGDLGPDKPGILIDDLVTKGTIEEYRAVRLAEKEDRLQEVVRDDVLRSMLEYR